MRKIAEGVGELFQGLGQAATSATTAANSNAAQQPSSISIGGVDGRWGANDTGPASAMNNNNNNTSSVTVHNASSGYNAANTPLNLNVQERKPVNQNSQLDRDREGRRANPQRQFPFSAVGDDHHDDRGTDYNPDETDQNLSGYERGYGGSPTRPTLTLGPSAQQQVWSPDNHGHSHSYTVNPARQTVAANALQQQVQQQQQPQYNDPYELHTCLMIYSSSLQEWFVGFVMSRTADALSIRFYGHNGELKEKKVATTSSTIKKVIESGKLKLVLTFLLLNSLMSLLL